MYVVLRVMISSSSPLPLSDVFVGKDVVMNLVPDISGITCRISNIEKKFSFTLRPCLLGLVTY